MGVGTGVKVKGVKVFRLAWQLLAEIHDIQFGQNVHVHSFSDKVASKYQKRLAFGAAHLCSVSSSNTLPRGYKKHSPTVPAPWLSVGRCSFPNVDTYICNKLGYFVHEALQIFKKSKLQIKIISSHM